MDSSTPKQEALQAIVTKHFERFSTWQWCILAAGTYDSTVRASLSDLMTEIVQTLATDILRTTTLNLKDTLHSKLSLSDKDKALKDLDLFQGGSLMGIFADVLHVPKDRRDGDDDEELTALLRREVSHKMHNMQSVIINSSVWLPQPAVYVRGCLSSTESLQRTVCCAARCLGKVNVQHLCYWPKHKSLNFESDKCESSEAIRSKISFLCTVEAVTDILVKWLCRQNIAEESGDCPLPHRRQMEAQHAAFDIVMYIWDSLRTEGRPCFDMVLTFNRVMEFFSQQAEKGKVPTIRPQRFSNFVKKQFEKMMSSLKGVLKKDDLRFLVSLSSESPTPGHLSKQFNGENTTFPGPLPFSSRATPTTIIPTNRMVAVTRGRRQCHNDIKAAFLLDVQTLRENLETQDAQGILQYSSSAVRKISQDLVNKIYDHLMFDETYPLPLVPVGSQLSDSVISELTRKMANFHFAPEVLYATIEDAVEKLLQQVLLWLYHESVQTTCSEAVAGAVADIEKLITIITTSGESSSDNSQSEFSVRRHSICKKRFCAVLPHDDYEQEEVVEHLIFSFSQKLVNELLKPNTGPSLTVNTHDIVLRLTRMMQVAIDDIDSSVEIFRKEFKKVTETAIEHLHMKFGSADKLQTAVLSNDTSFHYAVIKYLQIHLNYLRNQQPRRSAVSKFFSAVGKKIDHALEVLLIGSSA